MDTKLFQKLKKKKTIIFEIKQSDFTPAERGLFL